MEQPILITWLNDFIFCPASIYYHNLYGAVNRVSYQNTSQINGTHAHTQIDTGKYSTSAHILSGIDVYCEQYGLIGKIDIFNTKTGELVERKKQIKTIYDGYVFQLFAQCFALREMGYSVNKLTLRSLDDNKRFSVALPEEDSEMFQKFTDTIHAIQVFDVAVFRQSNQEKCKNCIYEPLCSCSLPAGGEASC